MLSLLTKIPIVGNIVLYALMAAAVGGVGGTLWYRGQYESCSASIATEAAAAEKKLNDQKAADAAFRNTLETQLKPIKDAIQEAKNAADTALAKVPSNPTCLHTPASDAFDKLVLPSPKAAVGPKGPARP